MADATCPAEGTPPPCPLLLSPGNPWSQPTPWLNPCTCSCCCGEGILTRQGHPTQRLSLPQARAPCTQGPQRASGGSQRVAQPGVTGAFGGSWLVCLGWGLFCQNLTFHNKKVFSLREDPGGQECRAAPWGPSEQAGGAGRLWGETGWRVGGWEQSPLCHRGTLRPRAQASKGQGFLGSDGNSLALLATLHPPGRGPTHRLEPLPPSYPSRPGGRG